MDQFEAETSAPHFAVAAQQQTLGQACLLRLVEMEKTQQHGAGAVAQAHQQGSPAAKLDLGEFYRALDNRARVRAQGADGRHPRAVLVTQWQMEQQVADLDDTQPVQLFGELRTDPAQPRDRGRQGCCGMGLRI